MPSLTDQIREAVAMFAHSGTEPALIGGLAGGAHQVVRGDRWRRQRRVRPRWVGCVSSVSKG